MTSFLVGVKDWFGRLSKPKRLFDVECIRRIPICLRKGVYVSFYFARELQISLNGVGRLHPAFATTRSSPPSFSWASFTSLRQSSRLLTSAWIATHPLGREARASCARAELDA